MTTTKPAFCQYERAVAPLTISQICRYEWEFLFSVFYEKEKEATGHKYLFDAGGVI